VLVQGAGSVGSALMKYLRSAGAEFIVGMETQNWSQEQIENELSCGIQNVLQQIFELAAAKNITTDAAASEVAEKRLTPEFKYSKTIYCSFLCLLKLVT
jgi:glutamate dehydrogenase/leucine dehydrogenase